MRNLLVPAALVMSIAVGSAVATVATAKSAPDPKHADCVRQWKAEKKHTQTRKAFLAACEKA